MPIQSRRPRRKRQGLRGTYKGSEATQRALDSTGHPGPLAQRAKSQKVTRLGKYTRKGEPKAWIPGPEGQPVLAARDFSRRPRQWRGREVNAYLGVGTPPFPGIDTDLCQVCGERVQDWRAGVSWSEGARLVRQQAQTQEIQGEGYKSRGPVLWAMHVEKVRRWWERHVEGGCMSLWEHYKGQPPVPRAVVWICYYGPTLPADCHVLDLIETLDSIGLQDPRAWPPVLVDEVLALQVDLGRPDELPRLERARAVKRGARTRTLTGQERWARAHPDRVLLAIQAEPLRKDRDSPYHQAGPPTLRVLLDIVVELNKENISVEEALATERAGQLRAFRERHFDGFMDWTDDPPEWESDDDIPF